jgi:molybdenum cofactor cytidylyltransferase
VGLEALAGLSAEAALVVPVDLPLVSAATVCLVLRGWRAAGAAIARPVRSDGRHGHPVVFAARLFPELRAADPAIGARQVLRAHAAEVLDVPVDDEGAFEDIDTPADYERLVGPLR